ncbi:MAG: tetratricopeptide repeat protein [Acidobacteria bacterium]|nr:tetratricopeptide repeat protein [Acidobacteriota bacterium]
MARGWPWAAVLGLVLLGCGEGRVAEQAAADPDKPSLPPGYVEAAVCRDCHSEIWNSFVQTGMGRAFERPNAANVTATEARYDHKASGRSYAIVRRGDEFFQQRWQQGPGGERIHSIERRIDYVMGSGNHARTFIHHKGNGEMVELPLGWYPENGGTWAMNPGYDRPGHDGFQRLIAYDCMFCHNGYPEVRPGGDMRGTQPVYQGKVALGVDCQRCHGPGLPHLEALQADESPEKVRASVVNPAKLEPDRRMDVCLQCHLESTSRPLPNLLHPFNRGFFSFRAGEALEDYAYTFDHAPGTGWDDKFEINGSAYRLMQSACFQKSAAGALGCTVCHDAHGAPMTRAMAPVCGSCHASLPAAHPSGEDCAGCHMPARRTDDVVHAVMTDHRIQKRPAKGLLAPKRERTPKETAYHGEVVPLLPKNPPEEYRALAQVAQGSNVEAGLPVLARAAKAPETFYELGSALESEGRLEDAIAAWRQAVEKRPDLIVARRRLGAALRRMGDFTGAERQLQEAVALAPEDSRVRKELGFLYQAMGRPGQALESLQEALRLDPDLPENHNNLGKALLDAGRGAEAETAFREAIRLEPGLAAAHANLGNLLAARGDLAAAEASWRLAIVAAPASEPGIAETRYNLAAVLAQRQDWPQAKAQLQAAVEADPHLAPAQTLLGNLLEMEGRSGPAVERYRLAIQADPRYAAAHWSLGAALIAGGRAEEGRAELEEVLRLEPGHAEARNVLQQLGQR